MTSTAESRVAELTDSAIKKRISLIDRLIETRRTHITNLNTEIGELTTERAGLVEIQIERLRKQLPQEKE